MADRDTKTGRFLPGNNANPTGRKPAAEEFGLLQRLRDLIDDDKFDAIVDAMFQRARRGDVRAAELLYSYILGKPPQNIDLRSDNITRIIVEHVHPDNNDPGAAS